MTNAFRYLDHVPDFIEFHLLRTSDVVQTSVDNRKRNLQLILHLRTFTASSQSRKCYSSCRASQGKFSLARIELSLVNISGRVDFSRPEYNAVTHKPALPFVFVLFSLFPFMVIFTTNHLNIF